MDSSTRVYLPITLKAGVSHPEMFFILLLLCSASCKVCALDGRWAEPCAVVLRLPGSSRWEAVVRDWSRRKGEARGVFPGLWRAPSCLHKDVTMVRFAHR